MSDVATVSICITVLVALLIIHLMIKNGRGIKLSGKTKFGDFGIETSETLQNKVEALKQLETKAKEIPVKVESLEKIKAVKEKIYKKTILKEKE